MTDDRLLLLSPEDDVFVLRSGLTPGEEIEVDCPVHKKCAVQIDSHDAARIGMGHKIARRDVPKGRKVLKYGAPIGSASADIRVGEHVHLHNLVSDWTPTYALNQGEA